MSPEQAAGDAVDRRADVFYAGVVLWELLTLRQMVTRDSNVSALRQVLHGPVPELPSTLPGVDAELRAIVAKSLKRDKTLRFQTAHDMRVALLGYLEHQPFSQEDLETFMLQHFQTARLDLQRRIQATIFPADVADPVISVTETETEEWDPILLGESDDLLPVLDSGSYSVVSRELSNVFMPEPEAESDPPPSMSVQGFSSTPAPPTVHTKPPEPAPVRRGGLLVASIFAAAALAWLLLPRSPAPGAERAGSMSAAAGAVAPREPEPMLRVHGSNTIGSELGPALAEAYLRSKGQDGVHRRVDIAHEEAWVAGHTQNEQEAPGIEIKAEGSATAFSDLGSHGCDVGMSSRPIKPAEADALAQQGLGDLTSPAAEHVIGLDGIAVVVHPNNPLRSIDLDQLKRVFNGKLADLSSLGGQPGRVHLFARDDRSGTYDTFKHLVLGDDSLAPQAQRLMDSGALSDAVASDPHAIGFIGLAYVRGAKAIPVAEAGAPPLYASAFTVSTEDYALSRRLYLYLPVHGASAAALDFVNFALSPEGQSVVRASGFVDLNVQAIEPRPCDARCSPRYAMLTRSARRLSLDFRFHAAHAGLDSRGLRDIDRLITFLHQVPDAKLMLLGFSDSRGTYAQNQALSHERAKKVEEELAARGVHVALVDALGQEMPLSSNGTDPGRERNRRVEVWLR
jgi:phosphate transport system substrate-binding protein